MFIPVLLLKGYRGFFHGPIHKKGMPVSMDLKVTVKRPEQGAMVPPRGPTPKISGAAASGAPGNNIFLKL